MFTVLWKLPSGAEELLSAQSVYRNPPSTASDKSELDCHGREHVVIVTKDPYSGSPLRSLIDTGDVFVMNEAGKTVARYWLGYGEPLPASCQKAA